MKRRRISATKRVRAISSLDRNYQVRAECERDVADLRLVKREEGVRFGRYYLAPEVWKTYGWAEVVTVRDGVLVHGDMDTVLFRGLGDPGAAPRAGIYWQARDNPGYGAEKAANGDTVAKEWDIRVARYEVLRFRREGYICKEQAGALRELLDDWDGLECWEDWDQQAEFIRRLSEVTDDNELYSAGEVPARRVILAQAILCRLAQELEICDMRESASAWFKRGKEPEVLSA